jgi:hypothetical protein
MRRWKEAGGVARMRLGRAPKSLEERLVQPPVYIFRQRDGLGPAEDLDGFSRGIHYDSAILAPLEMKFQLGQNRRAELPVEIVPEFYDQASAVHAFVLRSRK